MALASCDLPVKSPEIDKAPFGTPAAATPTPVPGDDVWYGNAIAACAFNGKVPINFHFSPPIFWNQFTDSNGDPFTCTYVNSSQMNCLVPDVLMEGKYRMTLKGTLNNGAKVWNAAALPAEGCPTESPNAFTFAHCDGTHLFLDILYIPADASLDSVSLNNELLSCSIMQPGQAFCGLTSAQEGLNANIQIILNGNTIVTNSEIPICANVPADTPSDQLGLWFGSANAGCAINGMIPVHFHYDPPIVWTTFTNSSGTGLDCWNENPSKLNCLAPDELVDGKYQFHLEGSYDGTDFIWNAKSVPAENCPPPGGKNVYAFSHCENDQAVADVLYTPVDGTISGVDINGTPVTCQGANGQLTCALPGIVQNSIGDLRVILDGAPYVNEMVIPGCQQENQPSSSSPASCPCSLLDVQCLAETKFAFIAQTCADKPAALEPGSITAQDSHGYSCDLIPGFDGRVYCAGPNPDSNTPLIMTFKQLGDAASKTCSITKWPPSIPPCPTKVPCSSYKQEQGCKNAGCTWTPVPGALGICK